MLNRGYIRTIIEEFILGSPDVIVALAGGGLGFITLTIITALEGFFGAARGPDAFEIASRLLMACLYIGGGLGLLLGYGMSSLFFRVRENSRKTKRT